ncbi:MAG: Na/Pi cotransporter family protein [Bacteroidales bacterium]|nr:Na/Pi cotransporter family protein [Bacteroidales bacterium]
MTIYLFLKLLGCLALLMYGMKMMSESLQKLSGGHLRNIMGTMTKNRFTGLLTGVFVTAAVQSSTATTVMTVSFVNAGLLSLAQAISVIMGANIGTTVTAWIMSVFGFQINMSSVVFPLFALAIVMIFQKKASGKSFGEFIFGFSFMFLGLATLRENAIAMNLPANESVVNFFTNTGQWGFLTTLLYLLVGSILTMCVQSSAAIMAITLILCSSGVLPIYQGIALVMGENIGTTVTSNIAALSASTNARRAALAHMVFNVFGVIWVLIVFKPFINAVCNFVGFDPNFVPQTDADIADAQVKITYALSAFHTAFNLCNVLILIWFIKPIEKFVCRIIKHKEEDEEGKLKFISGGLLSTAELSIFEAQKEISLFSARTNKMFNFIPTLLFDTKNDEDFSKLFARIEKYEQISDHMEIEIANYLNKVTEGRLSPETKTRIRYMLREVGELESIGDSCYNLARTINQKHTKNEHFTDAQKEHIHYMFELCNRALAHMQKVLDDDQGVVDTNESLNIENEINNYRNQLKESNINDINEHMYNYQAGIQYMDIINECEKLGDYVINVVEAHIHKKLSV